MTKKGATLIDHTGDLPAAIATQVEKFAGLSEPVEHDGLHILSDLRTGARYLECHIRGSKLVELGTIDVPLDPEEQPEYRANRELVLDHSAFDQMKDDARAKRTFSNIVAEFNVGFDEEHPIKVIGGQHRFEAIRLALDQGIDEHHGIKLYFGLDPEQRLDVQLISNTNIAVSTDLFDRMQETLSGPELRKWCQEVGLLPAGTDFADRRQRSGVITVRAARSFIVNYYRGEKVDPVMFDKCETNPILCKTGERDDEWDATKAAHAKWWNDEKLKNAGTAFAQLIDAQRKAFAKGKKGPVNVDFAEKALNYAVLTAWAFTAGVQYKNNVRLQRHFALKDQAGRDPLNAAALAKGRHKSDAENYRGLGYRTDPKERARLAELFNLQAEDGGGITPVMIDVAIKKYHAKEAQLEVERAKAKAKP